MDVCALCVNGGHPTEAVAIPRVIYTPRRGSIRSLHLHAWRTHLTAQCSGFNVVRDYQCQEKTFIKTSPAIIALLIGHHRSSSAHPHTHIGDLQYLS